MKGFLWSKKKSSTSKPSNNERSSRNSKRSSSTSSSSASITNLSQSNSNSTTTETLRHVLREKSSSSNLSSISLNRQSHISKHSIKSNSTHVQPDQIKRQSSLEYNQHHSNTHKHTSIDTSMKVYGSDGHARSTRSILSNHLNLSSNHGKDDIESVVSDDIATVSTISNDDHNHSRHHISKEDIKAPVLSPIASAPLPSKNFSAQSTTLINETSPKGRRDTMTRMFTHLNDDNFDSTTFKVGWINRSHGQVLAQTHNQMIHSPSTQQIRDRKMSHRESVLFGADMLAQLNGFENKSGTNNRDSMRSDNVRNSTLMDSQTMVPDYRIYRAELKGCLLNLYKDGLGNNIRSFDPTAVAPENTAQKTVDNRENTNDYDKRSTISAAKYSISESSTRRGTDIDIKEHIDPKAILATEIKYLSEKYPHPSLKLDKEHRIIGGDTESLCHAVLFSPMSSGKHGSNTNKKQRNIVNLLLLLPLVDYFIKFITMFNQYGLTFTKHKMKLTANSAQYYNITNEMDDQLTERLALVVKTILDIMPGFLLDEKIFQATIALLNTISLHNDEISNNLKISIANRHNEITSLTSYIKLNEKSKNQFNKENIRNNPLLNNILNYKKFLDIDAGKFANEVHSINLEFDKVWTPREDYSLLYSSKYINQDILSLNPLVFNNTENLHFLGRLLVYQLFPSDKSSITPKLRAKILRKWVQLGCKFEHLGDMVSWLAIATVICSVPVLRLFKSWQFVSDTTLKIIFKDWVPTIVQLERRQASSKSTSSVFILAPPNLTDPFIRDNVISYFGDLIIYADDLSQSIKFKYLEKKINRTKNAFHKWQQRLDTVNESSKNPKRTISTEKIDPDTSSVYQFWRYSMAQKPISIESLMQMSLQYEPSLVDPHLYSEVNSRRSPLLTGSYLPILFNELLPSYSLFPKASLIGAAGPTANKTPAIPARSSARMSTTLTTIGKSESLMNLSGAQGNNSNNDTNQITGIGNIDGPTIKELAQRQSTKQMLMKSIRDMFNIDTDLFHVSDDLVFKSNIEKDIKSRPTSMVLESPRKFSQQSFGNNSSRDSHDMNRLSKTLENMNFFDGIGSESDTFKESVIDVVLKSASLERILDLLVLTANVFSKLVDTKDLESYFQHKDRGVNNFEGNKKTNSMGLLDYAFVKLILDDDIFTETFFDSYRSFTTTTNVLENLGKRYIGAKSCAVTITAMLDSGEDPKNSKDGIKFPDWSTKVDEEMDINLIYLAKIQIGAAEAIYHLVQNHYSDFVDDSKCNSIFFDILKVMEKEVTHEWPLMLQNTKEKNPEQYEDVNALVDKLIQLFQKTKSTYQKELYRPVGINKTQRKITEILESFKLFSYDELQSLLNSKHLDNSLLSQFHSLKYNEYECILDWMQDLNVFIAEKMQLIDKRDWISVYQILELESLKSLTTFYNYPLNILSSNLVNSTSTQLKDLEILNIFTWLSTLVVFDTQTKSQSSLIEKLPNSVQIIIKLHRSVVSFFKVEITNPKINIEQRNNICAVLVQMLNFARTKNATLDLFESVDTSDPHTLSAHIPSFIESAICDAIVSPDSRLFEQNWKSAYSMLSDGQEPYSGNLKSICHILDGIDKKHMKAFISLDNVFDSKLSTLTPCPGWFISRLLEISQFVPNMSISNTRLINFDKRRFVHNIIANITVLIPTDMKKLANKCGYALMNEFADSDNTFRKACKELAMSEARITKYQECGVFNDILISEVDKIKREQVKLDSLKIQEKDAIHSTKLQQDASRQKVRALSTASYQSSNSHTHSNNQVANGISTSGTISRNSRNSISNVNTRTSVSGPSQPAQSGGVSKKLGGFFRRPFSIAGFNTSMSNYSLNSSLSQDVGSKKVIESYLLPDLSNQVINESKPSLCLKTFDIKSILEIMNHRNIPAYAYSFKIIMQDNHEYTIQATSSEDLHDWIKMIKASKRYSFHSRKFKGKTSNKVFGVPLEDICAREGTVIPTIIIKLLEEIELRGLDEVGLYRIPGSVGSINALKKAFDEEGATHNSFTLEDDRWFEINAIAGCFKMYLRELPDSLFSNEKVSDFTKLALSYKAEEISRDVYRSNMITLLNQLPVCYYQTMRRIVLHLNKVHQHVSNNRMDASNLAIVFSMSFIDQEDLSNSMGPTLGAVQSILQDFIKDPSNFFIEKK
ncbi:hypothetical protein C6P45_002053 [Maudiozyma exigua]|uniref:Rho-GAP domain-containing protein n=1 Tax=Maudiozyma exigua TaxID=34358 RepID=A0A9P7B5B6_MAUEX|nr:hypothetical protein C6P45_002053 [Kazachstania exigua]